MNNFKSLCKSSRRFILLFLLVLSFGIQTPMARAADVEAFDQHKVDLALSNRISKILQATEWYPDLKVEVKEGLVFLRGKAPSAEKLTWAKKIIEETDGVVAVVNDLDQSTDIKDALSPAKEAAASFAQRAREVLPFIISPLLVLLLFGVLAYFTNKWVMTVLVRKHRTLLVSAAIAKIVGIVVFLLGMFLALRTSGFSGLAFTVLGGTGVIGLGIGLALKSSFENYASGLMISLREIFRRGEIVNIGGFEGLVQSVTTRGTTIMDYDGNNITFPNSYIMNTTIKNLTRNPNMRANFQVGIGYDDSIDHARAVILSTLKQLAGQILSDPESVVTVDELAPATVNLRVYFWFDSAKYSLLKMRSLVIQRVKEALMREGVSMPDDAREVVFKTPLHVVQGEAPPSIRSPAQAHPVRHPDLKNEIVEVQRQAEQSEAIDTGTDILK
ncbi:mechanosensitive ion channel family protein [soil metagenome]